MPKIRTILCLECDTETEFQISVDEFGYQVDDNCPDSCPECNADLNCPETNFPEDFCRGT